jgi:hypothetical protein
MAEHEEHPAEGTPRGPDETPAGEAPPAAGAPAAHPHEGAPPPPPPPGGTAPYATTAPAPPAPAPPGRFSRWSANAGVRMGAVAIVAGLVGGLVGGGIVAAFNGDGHDHAVPVRFAPGMQRGGPGFGAPGYWGQQPNRVPQFRRGIPQPNQPVQPATPVPPTPSPKSSG